ncbi:hypothetical protein CN204_17665 [Sinorhizobium meliloti]|uniref:hypothetical protein n=1 Tax=Rhizobium meliloti TaxID=382 RepID=UPI0002E7E0C4|nr:hypothetical protein [Sinorhizobium meliloti]MBP2465901.1 hypothetical protein [Sinorhizobium meliloti]MDE4550447.1 hypothetical protein [Sinorhizobium meliloti]MDE4556453.1 hypothetical protein [Sinorhizobium meliloti]MQW79216.1 hypothetical protein [Sinorhizobium meliloti]MQW79350.1 hypothetical protein [Sinorhizobium meliloti]
MRTWVESGQDPARFWRLTVREITVILEGCANRLKRQHNERAWLAWHIEALARQTRLPKLKTLLHGAPAGKRRMSPEEIEAVARTWLASRQRKNHDISGHRRPPG